MVTMKKILGKISGGKILDVATGGGSFVQILMDNLLDYEEFTGIDVNEKAEGVFAEAFKNNPNVHFRLMDVENPTFPDTSFDTVGISNSLHHFQNPRLILEKMIHLLRPGGTLIVSEMISDGQSETQMTHVNLHHWWAAIDRMNGIVHNETFRRMDLIKLVRNTGLEAIEYFDMNDSEGDPQDPEIIAELEPVIERYKQRITEDKGQAKMGDELFRRISEVGFHSATTLVLTGRKSQSNG